MNCKDGFIAIALIFIGWLSTLIDGDGTFFVFTLAFGVPVIIYWLYNILKGGIKNADEKVVRYGVRCKSFGCGTKSNGKRNQAAAHRV